MAVYSIIPSQFSNIDLRETLNHYGGVVGSSSDGFFSTAANIKMWSKHKPVRRSIMFNTEDPNWFLSDAGNYGIDIPRAADIGLLSGVYTYEIPVAGWHLRIGDFVGYNSEAKIPFSIMLPSGDVSSSASALVVKLMVSAVDSTYNVTLSDLLPSNSYFGCAITSGSQTLIKTLTSTLFNGGDTLNISDCPLLSSQVRGVKIKVFICTSAVPSWQGETTQSYYSLNGNPGYDESTINVVVPHENIYLIGAIGLASADRRALSFSGSPTINSGQIRQNATINGKLSRDYRLVSVTVSASRASDGVVVGSRDQPINIRTEPTRLYSYWGTGEVVSFISDFVPPVVPSLPIGDYYNFMCSFSFE